MGISGNVAYLADAMGKYFEHIERWLNQAEDFFLERDRKNEREGLGLPSLMQRFNELTGYEVHFDKDEKSGEEIPRREVRDMGHQLAILSLAMAHGCEFEFQEPANVWLQRLIEAAEYQYVVDVSEHLTEDEQGDVSARALLDSINLDAEAEKEEGSQ